jgi:hypothetical protein
MRKTINLTNVDGCYSKELRENTPAILLMLNEPSISVAEMRRVVHGIVEFATINASAKKRFISNLMECRSKDAIHKLCKDAVIHGMYYHPKTTNVPV